MPFRTVRWSFLVVATLAVQAFACAGEASSDTQTQAAGGTTAIPGGSGSGGTLADPGAAGMGGTLAGPGGAGAGAGMGGSTAAAGTGGIGGMAGIGGAAGGGGVGGSPADPGTCGAPTGVYSFVGATSSACLSCTAAACCGEAEAAAAAADYASLEACLSGCQVPACATDCLSNHPLASEKLTTLAQCKKSNCAGGCAQAPALGIVNLGKSGPIDVCVGGEALVGGAGVALSSGRAAAALAIAAGSTTLQVVAAGGGCDATIGVVTTTLVAGEATTLVLLPNDVPIALSGPPTPGRRVRFVHAAQSVGTATVYDGPSVVPPPGTPNEIGSASPFGLWKASGSGSGSGGFLDPAGYWTAPDSSSADLAVAGGQSPSGVPSEATVSVLSDDPRTYFVIDGPTTGSLRVVRCESGPCGD
jgi:hypothetical protein